MFRLGRNVGRPQSLVRSRTHTCEYYLYAVYIKHYDRHTYFGIAMVQVLVEEDSYSDSGLSGLDAYVLVLEMDKRETEVALATLQLNACLSTVPCDLSQSHAKVDLQLHPADPPSS